jgi:two-component system, OmpR family, sensor histidine kinase VanS
MDRRPGLSARLKLTISYAGFLLLAGTLLLAMVWVFLLRYVPDHDVIYGPGGFIPNRRDLLRAFAPAAAAAVAFLLVFGVLGGWILASRMLAPLTRIADAARMAANGSLSHRIRMEGSKDEFRELADVFDTMLEQLESQVLEQQRFAANASHELRTPLAISQTLLDVARNDPTRDQGVLIERLHTVNTRAIDLTEALLLLSRSDLRSFTREPVDLSLVAEEATETLLPLAEQRRITLDVAGETTQTVGSGALILRMVTNLVQNAIVHNLPTGGTVTIHTESQHDASVLRVENTGRPLPSELVATLTEPFRRGTERVRTDEHAGVGLGLAIVHSIVRAHDGTLDLTPRPAGGLLVTVRLPGMPQASSPNGAHEIVD